MKRLQCPYCDYALYISYDRSIRCSGHEKVCGAVWDENGEPVTRSALAPVCPYTHAHTKHWCGYDGCRDS